MLYTIIESSKIFIMKKIKNLILLTFLAVICAGCPDYCTNGHEYITFVNKSGKEIGYQITFKKFEEAIQDTIFRCHNVLDNFIPKDSILTLGCDNLPRSCCWERDLENEYYIQFLILDDEKFKQYYGEPCDTVRKYVPITYCYRLTLEDLQRMNWTVVYPPEKQDSIEL